MATSISDFYMPVRGPQFDYSQVNKQSSWADDLLKIAAEKDKRRREEEQRKIENDRADKEAKERQDLRDIQKAEIQAKQDELKLQKEQDLKAQQEFSRLNAALETGDITENSPAYDPVSDPLRMMGEAQMKTGNIKEAASLSRAANEADRLQGRNTSKIVEADGRRIQLTIDPEGRIIEQQDLGGVVQKVSGGQALGMYDETGAFKPQYNKPKEFAPKAPGSGSKVGPDGKRGTTRPGADYDRKAALREYDTLKGDRNKYLGTAQRLEEQAGKITGTTAYDKKEKAALMASAAQARTEAANLKSEMDRIIATQIKTSNGISATYDPGKMGGGL